MLRRVVGLAVLGLAVMAAGPASAQVEQKKFNVVGTWNFLTNWKALEQPFVAEALPKASGGKLTGNIKSITELNLKGTELLRLVKSGVYDMAAVLPIYVDDGAAMIEAIDLAGVANTFKQSREIVNAWMPEMQKVMQARHGATIVASFTFPEQNFYCRGEIKSVADLKGKKVRVQGTSQSDIVRALGGVGVTIAFGEVVPALEKGVVDCGITGTMPAYKAKWPEVTNTLFRLPVGFTTGLWIVNNNTWNKLQPATRELLTKEFKALEDRSWQVIEAESEEGVNCTTGTGPVACKAGTPAKLKLVTPSAADIAARNKGLNEVVLSAWAKRCGAECAQRWNEVVGKMVGLTAKAN